MTAEVGVLNSMGVALAADSAVSIGPNADKIYSSADKLFHLSASAPVAIMINGNATLMGIPWETVIKSYRSKSVKKLFPTLREYRDDFLRYVNLNRKMFSARLQEDYAINLARSFLFHVRQEVEVRLDREAEQRDGLDDNDIPPIIHDVISEKLQQVFNKRRLPGFGPSTVSDIRRQYSRHITAVKKEVFGNLKLLPKTQRAMSRLVIEVFTRDHFAPYLSGVVFAGFGEEEYMPRLYSISVELMIKNKLRAMPLHEIVIDHETTASIVPFAQQEMVHAFLKGIDPDIDTHIRHTSTALFLGMVDQILDAVEKNDAAFGKVLRRTVKSSAQKALQTVYADWDEQSRDYWRPIIDIASSLPKDELGSMAEALVNLTKFRRRVSKDRETVAGPIDVAVITKGDGFVWVKRKHYFESGLNPRILARYGRGG